MAFDWITGNNLPQFWKTYTSLFDRDDRKEMQSRFVVFDMETSGLDTKEDYILSIAAIGVTADAIEVGDFLEIFVKQDKFAPQSLALQGMLRHQHEKVVEAEAVIQFLNFIKDATLVSHNVNMDIEMLNMALKRLELGRLKNPIMDTNVLYQKWKGLSDDAHLSLDELCDVLKLKKSDRHTAAGNAYTAALIFLKLKKKLGI